MANFLTLTGNPALGITRPFGILQVNSFDRTWALQLTPPMVIMIFMHDLTVLSFLCYYICGHKANNMLKRQGNKPY